MHNRIGRLKGEQHGQHLVQEAAGVSSEDDAEQAVNAASSVDDWLPPQNQPAVDGHTTQVSRVVCKVGAKSFVCAQVALICGMQKHAC